MPSLWKGGFSGFSKAILAWMVKLSEFGSRLSWLMRYSYLHEFASRGHSVGKGFTRSQEVFPPTTLVTALRPLAYDKHFNFKPHFPSPQDNICDIEVSALTVCFGLRTNTCMCMLYTFTHHVNVLVMYCS